MAMIVCSKCEERVSDEFASCPICKRPLASGVQIRKEDGTFISEYPESTLPPVRSGFDRYFGSTPYRFDPVTCSYSRAEPYSPTPYSRAKSYPRKKPNSRAKQDIRVGLVVDEPWITKIAHGVKTWEMRSRSTTKLERIALIKKGSGLIVCMATISNVFGPLNDNEIKATFEKHRVPIDKIGRWRFAWVLDQVHRLAKPIPYRHPKGAVTWVRLDSTAMHAVTSADSGAA